MTAFTLLLTVILLILFFGYKRIPVIARYIGSAGYELKKGWKGGVDGARADMKAVKGKVKKAASAVKSKVKSGARSVKSGARKTAGNTSRKR